MWFVQIYFYLKASFLKRQIHLPIEILYSCNMISLSLEPIQQTRKRTACNQQPNDLLLFVRSYFYLTHRPTEWFSMVNKSFMRLPYWEQYFYGGALLATILPVLGFCLKTGYVDSIDFCACCFLIQHSAHIYWFDYP